MYLVLGKENCSRCAMVKNLFKNRNIDFEYKLLSSLDKEDQSKYMKIARESGQLSMPLIVKDDKIVDFEEVIEA